MNLISAILLSISANLDTFTVAISYGLKKIKLSTATVLLISLITTLGTFISMSLGLVLTKFISIYIANLIGSLMLICIGVCIFINFFKESHKNKQTYLIENNSTYSQILTNPITADKDNSGDIDFKESITLALALTINNFGIGIAASIAGINIYLNTFCTFIVTILSILLGISIGNSYLSKLCGKYAELISGLVIIILGIYEAFL
ncbi:sporulation membrane protein YtaF [Romboutsia maritimum]|uniref:Sporulation membrane protein YtaF n=1 Tax=Romboutsia maritimum TaxID=2020948 RepID=A0A371ISU6_9FIRM|nr:sporulation membrane protein YtaF [Romboutsia maritimum]RDY23539.1 sporulation membrane protein YtaF [Romboutsia maritimum]